MQITFNTEYLIELTDNSVGSSGIHPKFKISLQMANRIFDVQGIRIMGTRVEYIVLDELIFRFLSKDHFNLVESMVPDTWCIGGFSKNFPFQYADGCYGRADTSTYYWGLPIFFSHFSWFNNFHDGAIDSPERLEVERYLELGKEGADMIFAKYYHTIEDMIELIQKLP